MAKIHGIVYLMAGLFISSVSWKLNKDKLLLFYYVGFVFVLIGVIKIVYALSTKKNRETAHIKNHNRQMSQYKRCNKCGSVMRFNDRFCGRCGARN